MQPLAILGGTFDPIHHGHLRVAWEAAEALAAEVRLVPAAVPPHRATPVAPASVRLAMLHAALAGQDRLSADDRELRRVGPSYSVDTLAELRSEIGAHRPLVFLLGSDAFAGLSTWNRWRQMFDYAHLGVLTRPGHGGEWEAEVASEWFTRRVTDPAEISTRPAGAIISIPVTPLDISASAIRARIRAGRSPRWLLPESVLAIIESHGLYRA